MAPTTTLFRRAEERFFQLSPGREEHDIGTLPLPATLEQKLEQRERSASPSITATGSATSVTVIGREEEQHVGSLAKRIHGWTWQAFPVGMGTSAVYLTLSGWHEEYKPRDIVEHIFFYLTVSLFIVNVLSLFFQAILYPHRAKELLMDPVKGVFFPLLVLSLASIIIGIMDNEYGACKNICGPNCAAAWFWVYVCVSVVTGLPMLLVWFSNPHPLEEFTPVFAFPIFPLMLTGVVAFNALKVVPSDTMSSVNILFVGLLFQGLGFFMTFFYICIYFLRIITGGVLKGGQASGAFVICGPPGFTALALIKLGEDARDILPQNGLVSSNAGETWYDISIMGAIMLYGLAIFLFVFSAITWGCNFSTRLHEILGFWALTFPNVGWILATRLIGDIFHFQCLMIAHVILCICLGVTWVILFALTLVAFKRGFILQSTPEDVIKDAIYPSKSRLPIDPELGAGSTSSIQSERLGELP